MVEGLEEVVKSIGRREGEVFEPAEPPMSSRSSTFDFFCNFRGFGGLCPLTPTSGSISSTSSSSLSTASPLPGTPSPSPPCLAISNRTLLTPSLHSLSLSAASDLTSPIPRGKALFRAVNLAIHLSTSTACEQNPSFSVFQPCRSPNPNTE